MKVIARSPAVVKGRLSLPFMGSKDARMFMPFRILCLDDLCFWYCF